MSVLELAKSEPGMSILADAMDAHPELLVLTEQLAERGIGQRKSGAERLYTGLKLAPARVGRVG